MITRTIAVCLVAITLTGCANFRSSRHLDMKPFAENTINLVAEINYGLDANHAVYLRQYAGGAPVTKYRAHWDYYRPVLRGIAIYSLGLVTLSRSSMSGEARAQQMADFLERMFKAALVSRESMMSLTPERVDEILADIRAQKNLLDALSAAQPFVDEVARFSGEYLDIIKDSQDEVAAWLGQQVDDDHASVLAFNQRAKASQTLGLSSLALLAEYRHGRDPDALNKLLEFDHELAEIVPDVSKATTEDLHAIEDRLIYRLHRLQEVKEQVGFDLETYRNMTRELDELVRSANANLRRTRMTIFVWAGAHRRMAAGITDPARVDLMGVAKRALDIALPL